MSANEETKNPVVVEEAKKAEATPTKQTKVVKKTTVAPKVEAKPALPEEPISPIAAKLIARAKARAEANK